MCHTQCTWTHGDAPCDAVCQGGEAEEDFGTCFRARPKTRRGSHHVGSCCCVVRGSFWQFRCIGKLEVEYWYERILVEHVASEQVEVSGGGGCEYGQEKKNHQVP